MKWILGFGALSISSVVGAASIFADPQISSKIQSITILFFVVFLLVMSFMYVDSIYSEAV